MSWWKLLLFCHGYEGREGQNWIYTFPGGLRNPRKLLECTIAIFLDLYWRPRPLTSKYEKNGPW